MISDAILAVEGLDFEYPDKRVLEQVSFTLKKGSITALVGPNGAGKTTLMRCIAGLEKPFSGAITMNGIDVLAHPRKAHTQLGYVSDFFGVYESLTVKQSLAYVASLRELSGKPAKDAIAQTAERLGLTPYMDKAAGSLSRGWRQRLGIAQSMLHNPNLLILDEPASGLDPEARITLSQLFHQLKKEGVTLLVSSHILAELEDYCSQMLLIRDGRISHYDSEAVREQCPITLRLLAAPTDTQKQACEKLANVSAWEWEDATAHATLTGGEELLPDILKQLVEAGLPIVEFRAQQRRLQDVYMEHAGVKKETADAKQ